MIDILSDQFVIVFQIFGDLTPAETNVAKEGWRDGNDLRMNISSQLILLETQRQYRNSFFGPECSFEGDDAHVDDEKLK